MQRLIALVSFCFSCLLLTGCAELDRKVDRVVYGSEEAARIGHAKIVEDNKNYVFKKQRDLEKQLYRYISEARMARYLEPYPRNDEMMAFARARARELAELYGPVRPNGQPFTTLYYELEGRKSYGKITREIRARNLLDPKLIMELWMQDSRSRAVILHPDDIQYAVGLYIDGGKPYWVFVISEMMEY